MVARWVDWVMRVVETWPDDLTEAPFVNTAAAEAAVRLADTIPHFPGPRRGVTPVGGGRSTPRPTATPGRRTAETPFAPSS